MKATKTYIALSNGEQALINMSQANYNGQIPPIDKALETVPEWNGIARKQLKDLIYHNGINDIIRVLNIAHQSIYVAHEVNSRIVGDMDREIISEILFRLANCFLSDQYTLTRTLTHDIMLIDGIGMDIITNN